MKQGKKSKKILPETIQAIDWNLCIKLASNKMEVAREILLFVIEQLPLDLKAIKKAEREANFSELLRCIHKLHGALCYSGMPRLKHAVSIFEDYLKKDKIAASKVSKLSQNVEFEVKMVLGSSLPC